MSTGGLNQPEWSHCITYSFLKCTVIPSGPRQRGGLQSPDEARRGGTQSPHEAPGETYPLQVLLCLPK